MPRRSEDRASADRRSVDSAFSIASPVDAVPAVVILPRSDSDVAREVALGESAESVVRTHHTHDETYAERLQREALEEEQRRRERERIMAEGDRSLAAAMHQADLDDMYTQVAAFDRAHEGEVFARDEDHTPWFSRCTAVVLIIVMIAEVGVNGWKLEDYQVNPLLGPSVETLSKMGAKDTSLILEGEFYRIFTPIILHAGFVHLLFNLLALYNIGFSMERDFGSLKISIIFIGSGIFGVLLSAIFLPQQLSVGASGALFGLFGAAWSDLLHNWSLYGNSAKWVLLQLVLATIFNLGLGLLPYLDNFAHFGGFCCGLFLGFTLLVQKRYNIWGDLQQRKTYQVVVQSLALVILPILFVVLTLVLYLDVNVADSCDWCSYISCVPLPIGASEEDLWWEC
ncbi:RHOMBOID-like protein 4 [Hondaea fermentalgiana]|uniref:rhomboid protease n=1 Tax=Hondaea fermentalgiana TaxID=2315210 RepID=A0A2R5H0C6_9STRA|nr:RHOMBOID-like protein 4 [Hondaea fermentalgiana]|eukprot:GBG34201.1 RHOMBOID-like protein 4 [Hondaea fermentalgiana]